MDLRQRGMCRSDQADGLAPGSPEPARPQAAPQLQTLGSQSLSLFSVDPSCSPSSDSLAGSLCSFIHPGSICGASI